MQFVKYRVAVRVALRFSARDSRRRAASSGRVSASADARERDFPSPPAKDLVDVGKSGRF
jgi:hypothetical protein